MFDISVTSPSFCGMYFGSDVNLIHSFLSHQHNIITQPK
nr:MAG TPA: hypothetical protein [Caudoviricetes sp.]